MTDIMKCMPCHGLGKIVGLGNIKKDCHHCLGVGYIGEKEEVAEEVKEKKPKGRKKKVENKEAA